MATRVVKMVTGNQLTTSVATYYTSPSNTQCVIRKLSFCNTSAGAVTVTVYLVPSGGTAGASNTLHSAKSLAAGETWSSPDAEGQVLGSGATLQMLASAATSITCIATGMEIT